MTTHRIGVLGLHHDHIWGNLEELVRLGPDRAQLVAAADTNQPLLDKFQSEFGGTVYGNDYSGLDAVYDNYDAILDQEDLTAVYVFGSNKLSEELTVKACERGLHCLVEKPMAARLDGADRMLAAAKANDVRLVINWPFAWWPQLQHAISLAQSGEIGQLWQVKYRAAHEGPVELGCSEFFCDWLYDEELNGAGALMDYCCYGAVLAQVMLGAPASVIGVKLNTGLKPDLTLEDNAILVLSYPNALATTEASWNQIGKMTAYTVLFFGSTGTLLVEPRHGGPVVKATAEHSDGIPLDVPGVPPELETASAHFLHLIENPDAEVHPLCEAQNCRDAQEILEAGMIAAREERAVRLPLG